MKKEKTQKNIRYFNLIDCLYRKKEEMYVNFNFINFNYFNNFKSQFDKIISKLSSENYHLIEFGNSENKSLIYQTYELDDRILLKYIDLIKNTDKEKYSEKFYKSLYIEEKTIKDIKLIEIESLIENNCIASDILSCKDICFANIILLFVISLKSLIENINCQTYLGYLFFGEFSVVLIRKYYTFLIKMIYKLFQEFNNKKQYGKARKTILNYYPSINSIHAKNLNPNKPLINIINQINKVEISLEDNQEENNEKDNNPSNLKLYGEQLEEEDITNKNLYTFHNFISDRFIKEKEIVKLINESYQDPFEINIKGQKMSPRIRFNNGIHKIESFYYSQKMLLEYLNREYKKYYQDLDESKLSPKLLLDACLNIFIFLRNDLSDESYIIKGFKNIFYIIMNKFLIMKATKK